MGFIECLVGTVNDSLRCCARFVRLVYLRRHDHDHQHDKASLRGSGQPSNRAILVVNGEPCRPSSLKVAPAERVHVDKYNELNKLGADLETRGPDIFRLDGTETVLAYEVTSIELPTPERTLSLSPFIKRGIELMPAPLPVWIEGTYRFARYAQVRSRRSTQRRILRDIRNRQAVTQGPFAGMKYIPRAYCSEILPKLVGTYERELIPAIEAVCGAGCDRIVDVGAAEGFYAVGMALRNPGASIVAFELCASARYYLRKLAALNGVIRRIEVRGECNIETLRASLVGARRPALICDCEGAEDVLLCPDQVEPLRDAFMIIETHDGLETSEGTLQGITDRLCERFASTHEIDVIASDVRTRNDLPGDCASLTDDDATEVMNEGRPWAQWLFLKPRFERVGER